MVRWSSISFASLRASATDATLVREARPKMPSNRASILCSIARRTIWAGDVPRPAMLTQGQYATGGPNGHYERDCGDGGHRQQSRREQRGPEACDSPQASRPGGGNERRRRGERQRLDTERRPGLERPPEHRRDVERILAPREPEVVRRMRAGERQRRAADAGHDTGCEHGRPDLAGAPRGRPGRLHRERQQAERRERREQRTEREEEAALRVAPRKDEHRQRNGRVENGEP